MFEKFLCHPPPIVYIIRLLSSPFGWSVSTICLASSATFLSRLIISSRYFNTFFWHADRNDLIFLVPTYQQIASQSFLKRRTAILKRSSSSSVQ